jgi:Gpi18-like mannosyltransferase
VWLFDAGVTEQVNMLGGRSMSKLEGKLLELVEKHLPVILLLLITFLSVIIRSTLIIYVSKDAKAFLLPWYEQIEQNGGLFGLGTQVGNYNMPYQICIALLTYLPVDALAAYKLLSVMFDYFLAAAVGYVVYEVTDVHRELKAALGYMIVILSPIVFLNSAAWAQCDSIYTFFAVLALLFLLRERYPVAFVFLGMAFSFKLQAVFLLPFFLLFYYKKKAFSIFMFLIVPLCMIVTALPCIFQGRGIGEIFSIYMDQTSAYSSMQMNYPSFWLWLEEDGSAAYPYLKNAAILFTMAMLIFMAFYCLYRNIAFNKTNMIYMAFLLVYTCVLFLPSMHERYGYVAEILAIIVLILNRKTLLLFLGLYGITFQTYGNYLFSSSIHLTLLGVLNTAVYVGYCMLLMQCMQCQNKTKQVIE